MNQYTLERLKKRLEPIAYTPGFDLNSMPRAAVALILDPLEKEVSLILVRRSAKQSDPWSNQMAFPGGYTKDQDTSVLETAIRETKEEIGINLLNHELIGRINDVYSARRPLVVTPFVIFLKNKVALMLRKDEVSEAAWVPINDLVKSPVIRRCIKTLEGDLEVDAIQYRDQIIWGLTLRIISDLLSRLKEK